MYDIVIFITLLFIYFYKINVELFSINGNNLHKKFKIYVHKNVIFIKIYIYFLIFLMENYFR